MSRGWRKLAEFGGKNSVWMFCKSTLGWAAEFSISRAEVSVNFLILAVTFYSNYSANNKK